MPAFDPPEELLLRPATVLIWGPERLPVELLALGLADRIDPQFQWVADLCDAPQRPEHPLGPVGEMVPSDRRVVVGFLEDQFPVGAELERAMRRMLRSTAQEPAMVRLGTYASMPKALQVALGRTGHGDRPGVVILANAHHLTDRWVDSVFAESLFHQFVKGQNTSLIATFLREPSPEVRAQFDCVLRIDVEPGAKWLRARVIVEKDPSPRALGIEDRVTAMSLGPFSDAVVAALARRGHHGSDAHGIDLTAAP